MPSINRPVRRVDVPLPDNGGGAIIGSGGGVPAAGPAVAIPAAPQNLRILNTFLIYSAVTPAAGMNIAWQPPVAAQEPESYTVEWATDAGFTNPNGFRAARGQTTMALDALPVNTLVYVRIRARIAGLEGAWSAAVSTTTPQDLTPPAAPASLVTSWSGATGDLTISWTNPASVNFRDVRVRIYASNGGTLLREVYSVTGRYVWTRGQNLSDTSGSPDPSVYLVLTARSWGGVFSATDLTGTATLAPPSAPAGLTHTWVADPGTAGPSLRTSWTRSDAVAAYSLSIDGVTTGRDRLTSGGYDYPFALNAAEHSGTPDPVLSLSLVAVDALGQTSAAATATATNAAPPATTISAFAGFSSVGLTIGASTAADLQDYRIRVYRNTTLVRTFFVASTIATYVFEDGDGSYTFDVTARDLFGQLGTASAQTAAVAGIDLAGFVADLRATAIYSDSLATAPATLGAALKDGSLSSGGVSYAANASWVRWVRCERELTDRYRTVTLSMTPTSGTTSWYLRVSNDGSTWSYYAGPVTSSRVLTAVASEAAAQAAAVSAATLGGPTASRVDLPAIVEARFVEVWLRNTAAATRVDEFYPRRLVQSDDIQAESITAVNIAVAGITADRISVVNLAALSAELGVVTLGTSGGLWQGTGTFASPTTGIKLWNDSGLGRLTTYNAGVVQVELNTSGQLTWGGGVGLADASGMRVAVTTGATPAVVRGYNFTSNLAGTAPNFYGVHGYTFGSRNYVRVGVDGTSASPAATLELYALGALGSMVEIVGGRRDISFPDFAGARFEGGRNISLFGAGVDISADVSTATRGPGGLWVSASATIGYGGAGLNVGSATGAGSGEIRAAGSIHPPRSSGSALFALDGTSQGSGLTIANLATATPFGNANNFGGLIIIQDNSVDGAIAVFATGGGGIAKISDPFGFYSVTAGTAGAMNVYISSGVVTIENRRGASRTINVIAIRTRTAN